MGRDGESKRRVGWDLEKKWMNGNRQSIDKLRKWETEKAKKTKIREFKDKFNVSHHLLSSRLINDGDYLAGIGHILSGIEKGVKTHTKKAAIWIMMIVLL